MSHWAVHLEGNVPVHLGPLSHLTHTYARRSKYLALLASRLPLRLPLTQQILFQPSSTSGSFIANDNLGLAANQRVPRVKM